MASQQSSRGQVTSFECTMLFQRAQRKVRTGRCKAALCPKVRAQEKLVQAHEACKQPGER